MLPFFNKVPVDVQNSSGFAQPHEHAFTAKVGQLVPADVVEILPGSSASLSVSAQIQLPPMATDFYGEVTARFFTFFVPHRLVYGGFEDAMNTQSQQSSFASDVPHPDPTFENFYIPGARGVDYSAVALGTIADHMGYQVQPAAGSAVTYEIPNIMPFLTYHLIWSEWFRDSRLQTNPFGKRPLAINATSAKYNLVAYLPSVACAAVDRLLDYTDNFQVTNLNKFLDGTFWWQSRQVCWPKDYFTNATQLPQAGTPARLIMPIDAYITPGTETIIGSTQLSMTSLFGLNALQRWKQIKNISGNRFGELQYAIFGVYPESYICDRPIYLGHFDIPVYTRSVFQTVEAQNTTRNPFDSVASKYGSTMGVGSGRLVGNYRFTEYGYLMTLFALVPRATYSAGIDRMFMRYRSGDFADPLFAGVGDQEIKGSEIGRTLSAEEANATFGYTQRFAEYKFKRSLVSGELRDGGSLEAFALQRSFTSLPTLGSQFIEVPQDYLDQVAAVEGDVSRYGCWVNAGFDLRVTHKLPAYSIGTLADPKDTHVQMVDNGGKRL